jgi:hypothetical protein
VSASPASAHIVLERVRIARLQTKAAQAQIDRWVRDPPPGERGAILIEGAFVSANPPPDVPLVRVAAGCVCCVGHLVLKVELTRLLRRARPQRLLLLLDATDEHLNRFAAQWAAGDFGVTAQHIEVEPA